MPNSVVTFLSLNQDILLDYVFPYLNLADLKSLALTCRYLNQLAESQSAWHDLYFRTFGSQPNPFTAHKWPEIYKIRSQAALYTWGGAGNGRLGYGPADMNSDIMATGSSVGCCRPKRVDALGYHAIADIVAGGYSFTIMTTEGALYGIGDIQGNIPTVRPRRPRDHTTGTIHHGPTPTGNPAANQVTATGTDGPAARSNAPNFTLGGGAENLNNEQAGAAAQAGASAGNLPQRNPFAPFLMPGIVVPNIRGGPRRVPAATRGRGGFRSPFRIGEGMSLEDAMKPKQLNPKNEYVLVSSGRKHVVAMDIHNDIYAWGHSFNIPGKRLAFAFENDGNNADRQEQQHKVHHLVAGWCSTAAVVSGIGLVIWHSDQHSWVDELAEECEKVDSSNQEIIQNTEIQYSIVPGTNFDPNSDDEIVDIMAGESFVVYLNRAGELFWVSLEGLSPSTYSRLGRPTKLEEFSEKLRQVSGIGNDKYVKLSGSFRKFAAFSSSDHVLLGEWKNEEDEGFRIDFKGGLQKRGCISVAVGDHHCLALLKGGQLLSWGCESGSCGSLGLGQPNAILEEYHGHRRGRDLLVDEPTVVPTEGHVLAIAAAGWQSGAVIASI